MEHQVLYRKYRPQSFSEIVGQAHVVKTLQNSLAQNKIAHAYLFAGPRGSGKTTIARILAKALGCAERTTDSGQSEPCNQCPNCADFNTGRSLDLIEIDAASNRGIDEIRALRENVRFGPSSGKFKVYLVDEAHMITKDAFNAFLKTLEEPPAHAVFILATTEAHRLLPTIISRTQRFDFKRLSVTELTGRLAIIAKKEKIEAEPEALKLMAHEADGSARDAEGLLGQVVATGESKITLEQTEEILGLFSHRKIKDLIDFLLVKNSAGALGWLHKTVNAGYDVNQLLKSLNHYVRKMIMVSVSPDLAHMAKADLATEDYNVLTEQTRKIPVAELASWLNIFSQAKKNFANYPLPQMALEIAFINLLDSKGQTLGKSLRSDLDEEEVKEEKKEIKDIPKENPKPQTLNPNSNVLELIQSKWTDIITEVKPHNHSLSGFLMGIKPKEATSNTLILATKYSFHKDRLSEAKNKKIIEDAVHKVSGVRLILNCVLEK